MCLFSDRERTWLRDIVENIDNAREYIRAMDFSAFVADRKTVDAVERCLQRITEAVARIGVQRMAKLVPGIDAQEIRSFGNVLRHEYDYIDLKSVFNTVKDDLPILAKGCRKTLGIGE